MLLRTNIQSSIVFTSFLSRYAMKAGLFMNIVGMAGCPTPHDFRTPLCEPCQLVASFLNMSSRGMR